MPGHAGKAIIYLGLMTVSTAPPGAPVLTVRSADSRPMATTGAVAVRRSCAMAKRARDADPCAPSAAARDRARAGAVGAAPRPGAHRHAPRRPRLRTSFCGFELAHPLGLAAGFDKNAEAVPGLFGLGFSFVEVGTVTPRPQAGNPKPRLFRLRRAAGADQSHGLQQRRPGGGARPAASARDPSRGPLGVNIGANRDTPTRSRTTSPACAGCTSWSTTSRSTSRRRTRRACATCRAGRACDELLGALIEARATLAAAAGQAAARQDRARPHAGRRGGARRGGAGARRRRPDHQQHHGRAAAGRDRPARERAGRPERRPPVPARRPSSSAGSIA